MTAAVKLSKRVLDAATGEGRDRVVWDAIIKGFGLRVRPSGAGEIKTWVFHYRADGGGRRAPQRKLTIGAAGPGGLTAEQARKEAARLAAAVRLGQDPAREGREQREAATVRELAAAWLDRHVAHHCKARTRAFYAEVIQNLILPSFGARRARDVRRAEVARWHNGLAKTPYRANGALRTLRALYAWGSTHGYAPEGVNPARGVELFRERGRERALTAEERSRLNGALQDCAARYGQPAAAAVALLVLTGARLREILTLEWRHVDWQAGVLRLTDAKGMNGKQHRQRIIHLPAAAIDVLNQLPRLSPFVFPGDAMDAPRTDLKRPWAYVKGAAGIEGVRLHDLRHTFASTAVSHGVPLQNVGRLLGHASVRTTERYAHLAPDALADTARRVGALLAPPEQTE